jgi:exopolysaccharide production protein ExoZ
MILFRTIDKTEPKERQLPAVQALRALACLLIVGLHSDEHFLIGASGVDLFFVISGFIMVYAHQDHFGNPGLAKPFLVRRFLRIYPLYWIGTLLVLTVTKWPTYHRYFTSFLLIPTEKTPILPPGWTLFHEVGFYLLFALCLRFKMPKAVICVCLMLLSLVCLRHALIDIFPITWGRAISLEFGMGCVVGYIYCKAIRIGFVASLVLSLTGLVIISVPSFYNYMAYDPYRVLFWGVGFTLIFVSVVFGPQIKFLRHPLIQLFGDASYSIYIAHFTIVLALWHNPYAGLSTFVISLIFGLGVYSMIELPMMAALRKRFLPRFPFPENGGRKRAATDQASPASVTMAGVAPK